MKAILFTSILALSCHVCLATDDVVTQRQDIFKQFKKDAAAMGKLVKTDTPFNADEFKRLAVHLESVARQPWQYFPSGSAAGQSVVKTEARPEIWSKPEEWRQAAEKLQQETSKLSQIAATGDLAAIRNQFGAVQKSCKACHDAFRKD